MTSNHRYLNLLHNIRNWPLYFRHKLFGKPEIFSFVTKRNGFAFSFPRELLGIFKEMFMHDEYNLATLVDSLPTQPVVVDIGANAGLFDLALLDRRPAARIIACEPLPANFEYLQQNLPSDGQGGHRLYQAAVVGQKTSEEIPIHFNPGRSVSPVASIEPGFSSENEATLQVPAVTLEEILQGNAVDAVDLLKLDCEGAEYAILYHLPRATLQTIKTIVAELHPLDGPKTSPTELIDYLELNGYSVTRTAGDRGTVLIHATVNG